MRFRNLAFATLALCLLLGTSLVQASPGDRVKEVVGKAVGHAHGGLEKVRDRACARGDRAEDRVEAHSHRDRDDRLENRLCGGADP
jgi:hypothetical protein